MYDQNTNAPTSVRLLPIAEVCQIVGLGESTVWARARRGTFPKPVKLSERTTRWVSTEVEHWMAQAIARRA
ncbi:helix-turn-helix transcriptional regulator [Stenotrophomonas nematodicola]|jgi:prophage regulatory protein|uniref:helix-turn-helix transcriptional regulator n=1 Tax=Stenotrophomonas nematodicola TaxID=2656746 RepID=UPI003D9A4527